MHYYQFNIGDYASHTRHLDLDEDLAYRRLLDLYYLHERPLNADSSVVAKQIGMREKVLIVQDVLTEFFFLTGEGWTNERADKEIAHFHSKIEQASRAGKASAERRSIGRSTGVATGVQPNNKQEPITIKQETKKETAIAVCPSNVEEQVWSDFLALRKAKKAPMTVTALAGIKREADKASWSLNRAIDECVSRGWTGFKAEWVQAKQSFAQQAADVARSTVPAQHKGPDPVLVKIEADRLRAVPPSLETLAKMAELKRKVV